MSNTVDWQAVSWVATIGAIVISLVLVPGALIYVFRVSGPPSGGPLTLVIGVFALVPGFLMGATGLWVAARG